MVKRYSLVYERMQSSADGDYVLFDDYEKLMERVKELEKRSTHNHDCSVRDRNALAAAESALASARAIVEKVDKEHGHRCEDMSLILSELADRVLRALSSHPSPAIDGAPTALPRRIEELTAENRMLSVETDKISVLESALATERAAREQAEERAAELTMKLVIADELAESRCRLLDASHGAGLRSFDERVSLIAAKESLGERLVAAARREAQSLMRAEQAERERDTALARVKELEGDRDFFDVERMKVVEQLTSAESALASARAMLEAPFPTCSKRGGFGEGIDHFYPDIAAFVRRLRETLTSHPSPAPVAAPCAGRDKELNE